MPIYYLSKAHHLPMLIGFTLANYRSFKEETTFSLVASSLKSQNRFVDENNVFEASGKLKLLKSAAIYGANSSGKSNFGQALGFLKGMMINSSRETQSTDSIDVEPFLLDASTENRPSKFEIAFIMEEIRYRYGFEVTSEEVLKEWLYYKKPKTKEIELFFRNNDSFKISNEFKGKGIDERTRKNALFISVSAQFNVKLAEKIISWAKSNLRFISGLQDPNGLKFTQSCFKKNHNVEKINKILKILDLGFEEITVRPIEISADELPSEFPDELKKLFFKEGKHIQEQIFTFHQKFDQEGKPLSLTQFKLQEHESQGTQKIFSIIGPLAEVLENGLTVVIDEFDARLHPLLCKTIVQLFNSNETNPQNAQLIVMTHDTNLLDKNLFRRDQIWFTEKNKFGATDLYSLAEYNVRNDASFESDYIKGRYGAIPYIGNFNNLFENNVKKEEN